MSKSSSKGSRGRPPVEMSKTRLTTSDTTIIAKSGPEDPESWIIKQASTPQNTKNFKARVLFPNGNALQRIFLMYRDMYDYVVFRIVPDAVYITYLETRDNVLVSLSCTKIKRSMLPDNYFCYAVSDADAPFGISFKMSMLSIKDVCSQMSKNPVELVVTAGDTDIISINMFSPGAMIRKGVSFPSEKATDVVDTDKYLDVSQITAPKIATVSISSKAFCTEVPFSKTSPDDTLEIILEKNRITFVTKFKANDVHVDFFVENDPMLADVSYSQVFPAKKTQSFIRGSSKLNISVEFHIFEQLVAIRYTIPDVGETILVLCQKP